MNSRSPNIWSVRDPSPLCAADEHAQKFANALGQTGRKGLTRDTHNWQSDIFASHLAKSIVRWNVAILLTDTGGLASRRSPGILALPNSFPPATQISNRRRQLGWALAMGRDIVVFVTSVPLPRPQQAEALGLIPAKFCPVQCWWFAWKIRR